MRQYFCEYYFNGDEDVWFRTRCVANSVEELEDFLSKQCDVARLKILSEDEWADQEEGPREIETQDTITGGPFFFTENPHPGSVTPELAEEMLSGIRGQLTDEPRKFQDLLDSIAPDVDLISSEHAAFVWAISWLEVKKELVRNKDGYKKTKATNQPDDKPRPSRQRHPITVLPSDGGLSADDVPY